jgi:hypothetical protein
MQEGGAAATEAAAAAGITPLQQLRAEAEVRAAAEAAVTVADNRYPDPAEYSANMPQLVGEAVGESATKMSLPATINLLLPP